MGRARVRGAAFIVAAALGASSCGGRGGEGADCPAGVKAATPSGYCVPRYLSLKRSEVYGRKGPGKDYPTVFVYHARGLPVQVVDETSDWRRICDPEGGVAWVSSAMVDGRRNVMALGGAAIPLRNGPSDATGATAYLRPHAIAALDHCDGAWCRIGVDGAWGWIKSSEVWGLAGAPQCR